MIFIILDKRQFGGLKYFSRFKPKSSFDLFKEISLFILLSILKKYLFLKKA